jgi:hypothetical protein
VVKLLVFGKCRPRPLNLGALQMEGGGGVTFLSCLSRSPCQPESKQNLFLIYRIARRFHLVKSLQTLGRQPKSDIRHTAIMADNQEELIMQFVELTGTSPGKVKSTSPNYFVFCQLTLSRHSNILEQTDGILIAQSLNTSRV